MNESTCLYCAHFTGNNLPQYIRYVMTELTQYCSRVVLICEEKHWDTNSLDYLNKSNIEILTSPNKGYDFGKWYWAFKKLNFSSTERIVLMNDSMLLLSSLTTFFDWCDNDKAPVKGFLNSNERTLHLQSYLLVLDKKAIAPTIKYFRQKKRYRQKRKVIRIYELGLAIYWNKLELQQKAFNDTNVIANGFDQNPNYFLVEKLLAMKTPLIKRHLLMDTFGKDMRQALRKQHFNFDKSHYLEIIKNNYSSQDYKQLLETLHT